MATFRWGDASVRVGRDAPTPSPHSPVYHTPRACKLCSAHARTHTHTCMHQQHQHPPPTHTVTHTYTHTRHAPQRLADRAAKDPERYKQLFTIVQDDVVAGEHTGSSSVTKGLLWLKRCACACVHACVPASLHVSMCL